MTSVDRWQLPDGIEEVLPNQAASVELLRRRLLDLYRSWGYQLVIPPLMEFTDSLLIGLGSDEWDRLDPRGARTDHGDALADPGRTGERNQLHTIVVDEAVGEFVTAAHEAEENRREAGVFQRTVTDVLHGDAAQGALG